MKQLVPNDIPYRVGDRVAKIVLDEVNTGFRTLPLYLSGIEIASLDAARGDTPREAFIRDTILKSIGTAQD